MMKSDNLRKKGKLIDRTIKNAEKLKKEGYFEGAALAYLKAARLLSKDISFQKFMAGCFNNAGLAYRHAKKYRQAKENLLRALAIEESIFGKKHLDSASTLSNLGNIYRDERDFDNSEKYYQEALEIILKVEGNHSDTPIFYNNLASLYAEKGDFENANKYYQVAKNSAEIHHLENDNPIIETVTKNHQNLQQEIARLKREKLEAQAALYQSKKLEYLGQMATLMAHNINQPIAVLRMAASGALSDVNENLFNPEAELKPLLEKLLAQTERLSDMMGNFRHFARGDRTVLSAVNLNDVIEAIYQLLFVAQYQLEQIDLQKEFSASPIAHANEWALQEMLISLLSNARAAVKDKAHKQVAIKTWQQDQQVGFCIEDSGDGIAAENLPKLFTPFLSSKEEGMGLGLYFCRQITHDLGGSIDYYPSPLGGAGFKITLPAQQE